MTWVRGLGLCLVGNGSHLLLGVPIISSSAKSRGLLVGTVGVCWFWFWFCCGSHLLVRVGLVCGSVVLRSTFVRACEGG